MALSPHLSFAGQCEAAFNLYVELFGGELMMLAYRDTPMAQEVPPEWREKIVHATLSFNGCTLAGSDVQPEHYRRPQGFSVLVDVEGVENANRVFRVLAEGGSVELSMQQTFWSPAFGVLVDRFGIPWEINGTAGSAT
jgi:PhnB protein